jgi:hypothetical protein
MITTNPAHGAVAARPHRSVEIGKAIAFALIFAALSCAAEPTSAKFIQQGSKLVGSDAVGPSDQGSSVALSGDGNTAIVGGGGDSGQAFQGGAVWVFTRSNGIWTQQGPKLVGTGAVNSPFGAQQGAVALSGDGNTAISGGGNDNNTNGAAWVFTRSNGVWTQQGPKLIPNDNSGPASFGFRTALSADGNTAIVGGSSDNNNNGAAWVFTRSNGVWTQQGPKLVGTDAVGSDFQGGCVGLSADGNTALVGASVEAEIGGEAWVFTRSNGVWTQQGPKLVGTGAVPGGAVGGQCDALSADGNTVIIGLPDDDNGIGAAWVFTRNNGVWTQQGSKLVGTGAVGSAHQGGSVWLSADGNTAIVGGTTDDNNNGAAWIFTRNNGAWTQQGPKLVGTGAVGAANQGNVALSADGNTAIMGGGSDDNNVGAAWVFARPAFAGTPGNSNCIGQSLAALARQFGGMNAAAAASGYSSVRALQDAILVFCGG